MWKRPIRAVVRRGLDNGRIRSVVEGELKARRRPPAAAMLDAGVFVDRHGTSHRLDGTHRDRLKPGWRSLVDPEAACQPPTDEVVLTRARKSAKTVDEASTILTATAGVPLTGRLLEVGCYDGAIAFRLAQRPDTTVVASDLARYYVVQRPGEPSDANLESELAALDAIRERARLAAGAAPGSVEFVEDDISATGLEPASFDAIVSFEVLEHVRRVDEAFAAMHRLLRPGGVGYHEYNPFFSLIGGHSLCTLDFAWGHARLDATDFERYLRERRPDALVQALRFYSESLNRMTLADLRRAVEDAGLELVSLVPWSDRALVGRLGRDVLAEVRRAYPTATLEDLLATFVSVVVRRPA
jgi:2-polyprenyl-3-methyl-5-hydroxy-6-metoxy-1,4-benzoquinol methylase